MEISVMSINDYEDVYCLWSKTPDMGLRTVDDSKEGISRFIERNPSTNFVCRIKNELVGVILCGHDGRRGYIYHAAVNEKHRRQGIGEILVGSVLNALANEGINKVALFVYADNIGGNMFWESVGFVERKDLILRNISLNDSNTNL